MGKPPAIKLRTTRHSAFSALLALTLLCVSAGARQPDSLVWRADKVQAQIESADLKAVLGQLAAATGWLVYVEPRVQRTVSVRFKDLPPGEALKRLLGDLNFVLLPQAGGPSLRLFIYQTSLNEATQLVPAAKTSLGSKKAIPNELVVTLNSDSEEDIDDLARRLGAKVIGSVEGLNSFRLEFPDEASANAARERLANDKQFANVDSNYLVERPPRTAVAGLETSPAFPLSAKPVGDSDRIVIGLIDTPVQPLTGGMNDFLLPSLHVAGDPGPLNSEQLSHGTSMAETILHGLTLGSSEERTSTVRILPVDVYGPHPDTTSFDVAKGIYAALNAGANVINLSLGGEGDSVLLAQLIREARSRGVLFFGAAGNFPSTDPTYPAAYPEVVAVTAGDRRGNILPYANRGSFVDVIAPGFSVVQYNGESFLVTGTSAATAYVSGTAAGLRSAGQPAAQVEAHIREVLAIKSGARP